MAASLHMPAGVLRVTAWAAPLGAVTAEALGVRERVSPASARGRLVGAQRAGALRSWRPLRDRPALYTVTAAGLRALGLCSMRPCRISPATAEHAIRCCEAAVALQLLYPNCRVVGEPELRADPLLGSVPLPGGGPGGGMHRADLAVLPPDGAPTLAVEVELTVKAPRRLHAICTAWARSRELSGVLYVVAPGIRASVERAIAAARAEQRIAVLDLAALDELIPANADPVTSAA